MAARIKMVCRHCGSDEVAKDAAVRWDVNAQQWVISAVYDKPNYCDACGGECSLREKRLR